MSSSRPAPLVCMLAGVYRLAQAPALLPAAMLFLTAPARAGNEDEFFLGNRAALTAGAVTASVRDGSATFNNPAGLANADRSSIDVSASAYCVRFYHAPRFLGVDSGSSQDASVKEFLAIPTEIAYLRRLGEGVSLGLGYFVPRSSDFVLRENLDAPDSNGTSNFGLNLRQSRTDYLFIAAVGARATPWLRLGFGGSASLENKVDAAALFGSVTRGTMTQKSLQIDEFTTTWAVGMELSAGLQVDVTPELTIGVTLRSPRLRVWQDVAGRNNTSAAALEPNREPSLITTSSDVKADGHTVAFVRAGRYIVGMALKLGAGTLHADVDLQPALRDPGAGVERRLTLNGRVGYTYELSPHLALGAGLFSDRATEPQGASLVGAQGDFYGGTVGFELNNLHRLAAGESAESLQLSTVFALRYATSAGSTTTLLAHPEQPVSLLFQEERGSIKVHEIGLHVGSALHF
jgi:opacity protein-like surface antigen